MRVISILSAIAILIFIGFVFGSFRSVPVKINSQWKIRKDLNLFLEINHIDLPAGDFNRIIDAVITNSKTFNIDPYLILAIIHTESGFNKTAVGKLGEIGLMQIWSMEYVSHMNREKIKDIELNIFYGCKILKNKIDIRKSVLHGLRRYNGTGRNAEVYAERIITIYTELNLIRNNNPVPEENTGG